MDKIPKQSKSATFNYSNQINCNDQYVIRFTVCRCLVRLSSCSGLGLNEIYLLVTIVDNNDNEL